MQRGAEISPATQAESEPILLSALHHAVHCLRQAALIHRDRPGRPSLALDLMEELRPIFADRLALSLINRRQLGPADFERGGRGATTRFPVADPMDRVRATRQSLVLSRLRARGRLMRSVQAARIAGLAGA